MCSSWGAALARSMSVLKVSPESALLFTSCRCGAVADVPSCSTAFCWSDCAHGLAAAHAAASCHCASQL